MTTSPERGVEETHNTREELIKELRMVANMINMCERIQWGRETTLMDKAADMLETHHQELQKARESERERCIQAIKNPITDWKCTANLEDGDAHNHKTITVCRAVASIKALDQSELDQPITSNKTNGL